MSTMVMKVAQPSANGKEAAENRKGKIPPSSGVVPTDPPATKTQAGKTESPKRDVDKKKRRGRTNRDTKKVEKDTKAENKGRRKDSGKEGATDKEQSKSSFDCSGAIAQVCEGLWVSAVSGTRMGASLEATLLECGVTAVLSTLGDKSQPRETFQHHSLEQTDDDVLMALHDACDFINEAIQDGGVVFIHSRSGFSRSDWAVLIVIGYFIKYQNIKLSEAQEQLAETTKHKIAPAGKFRRDLVQFEEEALGETSVDSDWIEAEDLLVDNKSHSLSRQKLAENLNDRRLLKKKSPHK